MKRKRFLAVLTAASLSASMALTAMPVFAGDVVSVEASDAKTVDSPAGGTNASADATKIRTDLAGATVTVNGLTNKADSYKVDGTNYIYGVDSVSDVTFALDDDKDNIGSAKVTLTLSVATKKADGTAGDGKGSATITVDLLDPDSDKLVSTHTYYTAAQKLAALKMYAEAKVAAQNEGTGFADSDNRLTILGKAGLSSFTGKIASIIEDQTTGGATTEGFSKAASISAVTVGTATKATSSTDGSLPITLTYSVDVYGSDGKTTTQTDTSSLTGVIPKTKQQNDATYEGKIENAIEAATWTSDDFVTSGGTTTLVTGTAGVGLEKLKNVILSVDNDADVSTLATPTVGRYTAGTHGKDGAATVTFNMGRKTVTNSSDSFSVNLTIVEGNGHVQSELADAFTNGVTAAKTSLQANPVADKDAAVKVITDAIDAELAKTYNNKAYSADIKGYEVVVAKDGTTKKGFKASSTDDNDGEICFYIKVDTGRTSASDPSKTDIWYFTGTTTAVAYDSSFNASATTADSVIEIDSLAKLAKVEATSIALPSAISYNVKTAGAGSDLTKVTGIALKDYLTINPDGANTYTIRWTNSNSAFTLSDGTTNFGNSYTTAVKVAGGSGDSSSTTLPTLKYTGDAKASTTIKAELLDDDGNVVSSASAVVTAIEGFDDVQNKSYFAYNAINALSNTIKQEDDAGATAKTYTVNGSKNNQLKTDAKKKISSSPVAGGTGSNKFDPYADVTRAQFVTFLYRNACNEYTFAGSKFDKDPASYTATTKFSDVAADKYYAKAVAWVVDNGIVNGKTDTTFAPDAKITRAEAVTMIYRLQANGASFSSRQTFTDVDTNAYYADAVGYASYAGITNGKTNSTFAPNDNVTRGEAATFIYRAVDSDDGFYYSPVEVTP